MRPTADGNQRTRLRVLLQSPNLPHYRRSLFTRLCSSELLELTVAADPEDRTTKVGSFEPNPELRLKRLRNVRLAPRRVGLVWQRGLLRSFHATRPDCVVLGGVDPHHVANFFLFFLAKLRGRKVLWWGHGTLGSQGRFGRWLRTLFYRAADGALAYDERGAQRLIAAGLDSDRVFVVWNSLDEADYPSPEELAGDNCEAASPVSRIAYSGRLSARKELDVLLDAMARVRANSLSVELHVVGDGPEASRLKASVEALGLSESTTFHGALYGRAAREVLRSADLCVIPAWAGLAAVHAIAQGVPVLTHGDLDRQPPEVSAILPGETGDFFRRGDADSLAAKLQEWLGRRSELRQRCLDLVAERYTPERHASAIEAAVFAVSRGGGKDARV